MRGIPYKVTQDEIKVFFYGFGQVHRSDIIIEEREYGKRTGVALVFFENEEMTQLAKKKMNKNHLGSRYVELFDHNDEFMQKVCEIVHHAPVVKEDLWNNDKSANEWYKKQLK